MPKRKTPVTEREYQELLALRTSLRQFVHWSEEKARDAGLTPSQHQLLLAIRGHAGPGGPTVGDIAGHLLLRHHSAVGLIDRAEEAGLVKRKRDAGDRRVVHVSLTARGNRLLESLSADHLEEIRRLGFLPI